MNDEMLAQQWAKTGNLMDALTDEAWWTETNVIEAESGGWVEAGSDLRGYVDQLKAASPKVFEAQATQVKRLSILLPALDIWLQSWELGLSFDAVQCVAQRCLYQRLQQLTPAQETEIEALLSAAKTEVDSTVIDSRAIAALSHLFTEADWRALAEAAAESMVQGVLQISQRQVSSPMSA